MSTSAAKLENSDKLEREAYTVAEVSQMFGMSCNAIYAYVRAGDIPHKRLGNRILIPKKLFHAWLNSADAWESSNG